MSKKGYSLIVIFFLNPFLLFNYGAKQGAKEYVAKAAFIYNFTKFVEWEKESVGPTFVIGVIGESDIYKPLRSVAETKKVSNKKIEVLKFEDLTELSTCQILFVPEGTSQKKLQECISSKFTKKTLVITEKRGSLSYGSGINFLMIDNRIKFEVNIGALNRANIKASSQLLKLAQNVENQ
jgi:YfiR/HmsC-like